MLMGKRYLSRVRIVGLMCMFLFIVLATGLCVAQEKITLTWWWWGEQEAPGLGKWVEETVRLYEKQNPHITVHAVMQESDALIPAFKTAAAAKEGPDIQFFWGGIWTLEDAWLGNLAPISDYWSDEQLRQIPAESRAETFWNGKQWGVPFYLIGLAWSYNKKLFKKAGLDPENPPLIWEDYLEAGKKLRKIGVAPIGGGIKDGYMAAWTMGYLAKQTIDSFQDLKNAITGKESFTDLKHATWLYKYDELIREDMWNVDVNSINIYEGQELFRTGDAATTLHCQSGLVDFERQMGSDVVGVMMTPIFGKGKLATSFGAPCQNLAITSFAKYPKEAADFLWFTHTRDRIKDLYQTACCMSPDDRFDPAWVVWEVDKQILKWAQERKQWWYQYHYPPMLEVEGAYVAGQNLHSRKWTPEQAAKHIEDIMEKIRTVNPEFVDSYRDWPGLVPE